MLRADGYPRFQADDGRAARAALGLSRIIGSASRLWKQRGLGRIYRTLSRAPVLGAQQCVVELSPGTFFETGVFEPFWAPTIIAGRPYEPELLHVFRHVGGLRPILVDAGANYGFWSVVATAPEVGFEKAIAIEASPSTAARLRANAARNGQRIVVVERAVGATSGESVSFSHAWGHVAAMVATDGRGDVDVETISIDDAVRTAGLWEREAFVLKLDVEGFELPALDGARELRAHKDHVVCFEDFADSGTHGFEHVAKIGAQGYAMYYVAEDGKCERVRSATDAHEVTARHPKVGGSRNFFATLPKGRFHGILEAWAG